MIENLKKHAERSKQVGLIKETAVYTAANFTTRQMLANLNRMQRPKKKK